MPRTQAQSFSTLTSLGGVPTSRTLTINGTTFDLSTNRTWNVGTVTGATNSTLTLTGTTLGVNLGYSPTWTGQHTFTTSSVEVGNSSTGNNINIYCTNGATLIPALTTGNWVLGTGWTFGTSPDRIIKSSDGTGLVTQTGGTAPTIGTLYKVTITVTGLSVGSFTWTLGARSGGGIISANGTYTYYVEAFNTNRFIVTPTNTSRFTLSAISVQPVTLGTVTAQGNLIGSRVTSPLFESTIPYGTPVDTARMSFYAKDGNAGYPDNNTVWYDWNIDLNGVKYQLMKLYAVDATTWQLGGQFSIAPVYIQSNSGSGNGITIRYSYLNFSQAGNSTWMDIKKADTNSGFNMQTSMTDGATAWGYSFDTLNTFSTSGAKIAKFLTGGTEKASISKDGGFTSVGLITNRLTTKQQQWEYDGSNYLPLTVTSVGNVALTPVGSGAGFTISNTQTLANSFFTISSAFNIGGNALLNIAYSGADGGRAFQATDSSFNDGTFKVVKTTGALPSNTNASGAFISATFTHSDAGAAGSIGNGFRVVASNNTASSGKLFGLDLSATANTAGATAIGARITASSTSGTAITLRQARDTSNYFDTIIGTTGGITFDAVGSGAGFTFSDPVTVNGNLTLGIAGNKINITEGTNGTVGVATLVAGTVTVNTTAVTANSRIFLTRQTTAGTPGTSVDVTARVAGTSFTITANGSVLDTSTVGWLIIN